MDKELKKFAGKKCISFICGGTLEIFKGSALKCTNCGKIIKNKKDLKKSIDDFAKAFIEASKQPIIKNLRIAHC